MDTVFSSINLTQLIDTPTRGGSLLDVLACSTDPPWVTGVCVDDGGNVSDHRLLKADLAVGRKRWSKITYQFRPIKEFNHGAFEQSIRSSSLFTAPAQTADAFSEQMFQVITGELDKVAPLKTVTRSSRGKPVNRFLSREAVAAKQLRRRLERRWKRAGLESDRVEYRRQCRATNQLVNESRCSHYRDRINDVSVKKRWSAVSELLHSNDRGPPVSESIAAEQCNKIANFFQEKVSRMKDLIATRLSGLPREPFSHDKPHSGDGFADFAPVTNEEVAKLLRSLPSKSSPMDYVPTSIMKRCWPTFAELIATLANLSFSDGCFPSRFKKAIVTPLLKKRGLDAENPANYRPISNLNTISKMIERLALARLHQHIVQSPNYNSLQSAYRKSHSTETALLRVLSDVYENIDAGCSTLFVALDLSAAFDTVEHSTLLRRLRDSFGVSGLALGWVSSYLEGRSQAVRVQGSLSSSQDCCCGVPQGSVLGPLLFVVYISPLNNVINGHGVMHHQYADDTQVYVGVSRKNKDSTVSHLHAALMAVHLWFSQNGLVINPDKSETLLFSTAQRARISPVSLDSVDVAGSVIKFGESVKVLGVTFDPHLTFNKHVNQVCSSAHYHIRSLRHIRSSLSLDMTKTLASSLVGSRFDYANAILYGTSTANLTRLQSAQNSLARVVARAGRFDSAMPVLKQLHWLPIKYRIEFKLASLVFKIRSTGAPSYLRSLITDYVPSRQLRSSAQSLLERAPCRTSTCQRSFRQSSASVWNGLPPAIRGLDSFDCFKSSLKTHLFGLAFA